MNREYQSDERLSARALRERATQAFRAVIAAVVLHNADVADAVGLSTRDMQAIHLLQLRGPLGPGDLGRALRLASASTTALIDRLESAGYVRRSRDLDDRRKVVVTLVEERLAAELAPRYAPQAAHLERILAGFPPEELRTIEQFLTRLAGDPPGSGA